MIRDSAQPPEDPRSLQFGFFMNWTGTRHAEGFEFHLLAIAMAAAVVIAGAGTASVDRLLSRGR